MPTEDLQEIIQFTATGTFTRGAIYAFANFLGYTDEISDSPTTTIPNPLNRLEFVQEYIRQLLVKDMSKMNLEGAKAEAAEQFQNTLNFIENTVLTEVAASVSINNNIITP